jgi:predicted small metal-binding protein
MTNSEKHKNNIDQEFGNWLKTKNLLLGDFPTYIMVETGTLYYHFNSEHDSAQISLNPNSLYEPRPLGLSDVYNIPFKNIDMDSEQEIKNIIKPHIKEIHKIFFKLWSENDSKKTYDLIHEQNVDTNPRKSKFNKKTLQYLKSIIKALVRV